MRWDQSESDEDNIAIKKNENGELSRVNATTGGHQSIIGY